MLAKCTLHTAPELFNQYNALVITICFPAFDPNSGPAIVYTFSRQSAFKYALPISATRTSKSFNAATVNAILMLSHDITDDYVSNAGVSVICPPAANRAFQVKSILTSKIM